MNIDQLRLLNKTFRMKKINITRRSVARCAVLSLLVALAYFVLSHFGGPGCEMREESKEAYQKLKWSTDFTLMEGCLFWMPTDNDTALRQLLTEPEATRICRSLIRKAATAGKLYGLYGLWLIDQEAFEQERPHLIESNLPVLVGRIRRECITVGKVAKEMEKRVDPVIPTEEK